MEQIRIVKEMRAHDRANGRTGDMVRPRFMVWENVPGAFSSNKGQDFAAVLEEIIRIAEPEAPDIEVPEKGWNTWGGYHDEVGGRWSVAWRVHDAQHWGVPQRRRRISVVADFGGDTAGEILFERKSVSRHFAESGTARERLAGNTKSGASYAVRIRGGCDGGGKGALVQEDKSGTLGTSNDQTIFCMATQQGRAEVRSDDRAPTLTAAAGMSGNNQPVICAAFKAGQGAKANGIGYAEECAPTLGAVSSGLNQCPSVLIFDRAQITSPDNRSTVGPDKPCPALHTFGEVPTVCYQMQGFGDYREDDVASSCKQRDYKDSTDRTGMIVRRLTPMECERLQGFPDHWTDIGEWRDSKGKLRKPSDSPRYKALGNSIALPFWDFLAKRISAQYLRPVTIGSLFDGIGGFPLVFERHNGNGTARWASEIEEFPIAVTKLRFGEDA